MAFASLLFVTSILLMGLVDAHGYASWTNVQYNFQSLSQQGMGILVGLDPANPQFTNYLPNQQYAIKPSEPRTGILYLRIDFATSQIMPTLVRTSLVDATQGLTYQTFANQWGYYAYQYIDLSSAPFGDSTCTWSNMTNFTIAVTDSRNGLNARTNFGMTDVAINGAPVNFTAVNGTASTCDDTLLYYPYGGNNDLCIVGDYNQTSVSNQEWSLDDMSVINNANQANAGWYFEAYLSHSCETSVPFGCIDTNQRALSASITLGCGLL